ncbi:MAG: cell division protein FtsA [Candidatus Zixiibacteriota bacterium]
MDTIAVIDVGSKNTIIIIAEQEADGGINIIGLGEALSEGVQHGSIVNIEKASASILRALKQAEEIADKKIAYVTVSMGGETLKWVKSHGFVAIPKERGQINHDDVYELLESARAVVIPADQTIVETFVETFTVNDQIGIEDPVGMVGIRLEADVNIATLGTTTINNIFHILEAQRLKIDYVTLGVEGAANSVLLEEEAELGVAILDIGHGTTDIGIMSKRRMIFADSIRFAGKSISHDISVGLRIPEKHAEKIKVENGHCLQEKISENEMIEIAGIGGRKPRQVTRQLLVNIIRPRIEEILSMSKNRMQKAGLFDKLTAGIVLTGGTSQLPGLIQIAEKIFDVPVRIGIPAEGTEMKDFIKTPIHSAAVGAVLVTIEKNALPKSKKRRKRSFFSKVIQTFRNFWVKKAYK